MKHCKYHILFFILAAFYMCGCKEDVEDTSSAASYTEAFTDRFGKIGAFHDWNLAEQARATITPSPNVPVAQASVYIKVCHKYYLTASYSDIKDEITILADTPKGIDSLYVYTGGELYPVEAYGKLDFASLPEPVAKGQFDPEGAKLLSWIMAVEIPTSTPDFDYNDLVAHLSYESAPGYYIRAGEPGRVYSSTDTPPALKVTAAAAGCSVPMWLHYFNGVTDIIISPKDQAGYVYSPSSQREALTAAEMYTAAEWHQWFDHKGNMPPHPDKSTATSPIYAISDFHNDPTCLINTYPYKSVSYGRSIGIKPELAPDFSFTSYSSTSLSGENLQTPLGGLYVTVNTPVGANNSYGEKIKAGQVVGLPTNTSGFAPTALLIPDVGYDTWNWRWPAEGVSIGTPYFTFGAYAGADSFVASGETDTCWYTIQQADPDSTFDRTYLDLP